MEFFNVVIDLKSGE